MPTELHHEEVRPSEINQALHRILRSTPFQGSKQCQTLLEYLVEHALRGHDDELKERIIGIEVFGRKSDYDTRVDAIVRARAGEVRKRLAQYYTSGEGQDSAVRIVITPGSYRPAFVLHPGANSGRQDAAVTEQPGVAGSRAAELHPEPEAATAVRRPSRAARWRVWGIGAAAACAVLSVAWIGIRQYTKSEFDLFWGPIFASKKPVIIYSGAAWVYTPTEWAFPSVPPGDQVLPIRDWSIPSLAEGQVLTAKDIVVDHVNFSGVGEVSASTNLAVLLTAHRRRFSLRQDTNLAFEDLRGSPAILLGAYTDFWSMDLTQNLPYFFDRLQRIRERGGQGRVWSIVRKSGAAPPDDYAIVTRIFDSKTGSPVISLEGMITCGTGAAGEFVTDPAQLEKLASMGRDALEHKNLELVLHASLVNCTPTSIDIVAERSW